MVQREYRRYSITPVEKERLRRDACPVCGRERAGLTPGWDTICCGPSCTASYWSEHRPTVGEMRRIVLLEQEGKCAHCKKEIRTHGAGPRDPERRPADQPFILDHIQPIAMGGDQWAMENLQVLCARCNRIKTARDMGRIVRWKRYHGRGMSLLADLSRQELLLPGDQPAGIL
jgi:5-methylcytosine-specific restriction endonuclease McrA